MAGVKSSGTALDEITVHLATASALREEIKRLEAAAVEQEKLAERQAEDVFRSLAPHFLDHARAEGTAEAVRPQVDVAVAAIVAGRPAPAAVVPASVAPAPAPSAAAPAPARAAQSAPAREVPPAAPAEPVAGDEKPGRLIHGVMVLETNLGWVDEILADARRAAREGLSKNDGRYSRFVGSNAWRKKLFEAAYKDFRETLSGGGEEPEAGDGGAVETPAGSPVEPPAPPQPETRQAEVPPDDPPPGAEAPDAGVSDPPDVDDRVDEARQYPGEPAGRQAPRVPARPALARPGQRSVAAPAATDGPPQPSRPAESAGEAEQEVFGEEPFEDDYLPSYMQDDPPDSGETPAGHDPPEPDAPPPSTRPVSPGRSPIGALPPRPAPVGTPVRRSFNTPLNFNSGHLAGKDGRG